MGIYMCMKSGCRVSGEDFARSKKNYKGVSFYSELNNKTSLIRQFIDRWGM